METTSVEQRLRERIGLDPASTGRELIARAVRSRMRTLGIPDRETHHYHALLEHNHDELDALVEAVVISESWFFRDEQPFALLAERSAERPFTRVLSIPCAGGEEPYSTAIALLDRGLSADRFQIVAVDVSRVALALAREGIYNANAFRSKDLSFRDRHFHSTPAGFVLAERVKASVEFRLGNLVDPAFLAGEPPFNAILCRNLLIYLDDPSRRQALTHLDRLLAADGLIFLGHAEQLGSLSGGYRPAGGSYSFAFERGSARALENAPRSPPRPQLTSPPPLGRLAPPPPLPQLPRPRIEPVAQALPALDDAVLLADQGRHDEAAALCEKLIQQAGPSSSAYFLLGVVRLSVGRRDEAEQCFEKAVYLDPRHDEALLALSAAARRRGDRDAAENYLRRAGLSDGENTSR